MNWFDPNILLILSAVCILAGFVDAIAGGGGMLTVPAFLTAGMPPHLALGTNKLAASFGSFAASLTYFRKGLLDPKRWIHMVASTASGAIMGTLAAHLTSAEALVTIIPFVIMSMVVIRLLNHRRSRTDYDEVAVTPSKAVIHGHFLGAYDGFVGPGTGSLWTMSLQGFYKLPLIRAIAATKLMNFTSNLVSLITFIALGHVHFTAGLILGASLMLGSWLGAKTTLHIPAKMLEWVFTVIVLLIASRLIWVQYFGAV